MAGRPKTVEPELVLELKKSGFTNKEIAESLGVSMDTIARCLRGHKEEYKEVTKANQGYKKINLTDEQVNRIFRLKAGGYSIKEIAYKMGYSNTFISKILKGGN